MLVPKKMCKLARPKSKQRGKGWCVPTSIVGLSYVDFEGGIAIISRDILACDDVAVDRAATVVGNDGSGTEEGKVVVEPGVVGEKDLVCSRHRE